MHRDGWWAGSGPRPWRRLAGTSVAATLLAVAGHVVSRGAVPESCLALVGALIAATAATWTAAWLAERAQRTWPTYAVLGASQLTVEVLLSAPRDSAPGASPVALFVHASTTLVLGVTLLGVDRVMDDVRRVLDRVFPQWWRIGMPLSSPNAPSSVPQARAVLEAAVLLRCSRSLRGPPTAPSRRHR